MGVPPCAWSPERSHPTNVRADRTDIMTGNLRTQREVSRAGSRLRAFVIPSDEERLIARDTARIVTSMDVFIRGGV